MPRAVKITLKLWLKLYKLNSETETELRKLILWLVISQIHAILDLYPTKNNIIGVFNFSNVLSTYLIDSRRPWYASFLHMYSVYFREIKSEDLDLLGSQNVYCKEKKFFALLEVMAMAAWDNCLVSKKRNVILVYFRKCDLSSYILNNAWKMLLEVLVL